MKLFEINRALGRISEVTETDLISQGILETRDLESWIASHPLIFGRKILWLGRQDIQTYGDRSDLLGIQEDGEVLVTELKRGRVDLGALAQALRYVAEYASKSRDQLAAILAKNHRRIPGLSFRPELDPLEQATDLLSEFLADAVTNQFQTIILVGSDFDQGTLAACDYLNSAMEGRLTCECWQLQLFLASGTCFLSCLQRVPPPDLREEFAEKRQSRKGWRRDQLRIRFMTRFKAELAAGGYGCLGQRGKSYSCLVGPETGGEQLEFCIAGEAPYLSASIGVLQTRLGDGWVQEGELWMYRFPSLNFGEELACEALIASVQQVLAGLRNLKSADS